MGRRTRSRAGRAPLAAVALALLAALSACGGGDDATPSLPPSPTSAETAAPTVAAASEPPATTTASPARTPITTSVATASPTPEPMHPSAPTYTPVQRACEGGECIEFIPDATELETWQPGDEVDWETGAFVLEPETGRIHGYRANQGIWDSGVGGYQVLSNGWIRARISLPGRHSQLLLDRENFMGWRWPDGTLELEALSDDHVLFRHPRTDSDRYTLVARTGGTSREFSVPDGGKGALFSPDGEILVVVGSRSVYRLPVASLRLGLLFELEPPEDRLRYGIQIAYSGTPNARDPLHWLGASPLVLNQATSPGSLLVEVEYARPAPPDSGGGVRRHRELHLFSWDGMPLPQPQELACSGFVSPDGLYVAWQEESMLHGTVKPHGNPPPPPRPLNPVPAVVIADADTCHPIFRVLSAYTTTGGWNGQWLSNSEGLVVGVASGFAVARLHPQPHLFSLPPGPPGDAWSPGPVPAPTGDGRYFAYGFPEVYDADRDRWIPTAARPFDSFEEATDLNNDFPFEWSETHHELHATYNFWDGLHYEWLLLPQPAIEFPPFDIPLRARVAGTGSCLNLRQSGEVLGCLPDGTRLYLVRENVPTLEQLHVYAAELGTAWIYVRTGDGLEGWVAHEYLEHD